MTDSRSVLLKKKKNTRKKERTGGGGGRGRGECARIVTHTQKLDTGRFFFIKTNKTTTSITTTTTTKKEKEKPTQPHAWKVWSKEKGINFVLFVSL